MKRRPIKLRSNVLIQFLAERLHKNGVTPNQISLASVLFAALAGLGLCMPSHSGKYAPLLYLFSAVCIQFRLLCNVLDGLVAIEYGKRSNSGELFNDVPDRIADFLIFSGAGFGILLVSWGAVLGLFTAWAATMTAYVRTLSVSINAPINFRGPMAKQHRMACLTLACVVAAIFNSISELMIITVLCFISLGCMLTCALRLLDSYRYLESNDE